MKSYNVNPGLINPKRLFNWEGTIKKYHIMTIGRVSPLINKPGFINPGLTLYMGYVRYSYSHDWIIILVNYLYKLMLLMVASSCCIPNDPPYFDSSIHLFPHVWWLHYVTYLSLSIFHDIWWYNSPIVQHSSPVFTSLRAVARTSAGTSKVTLLNCTLLRCCNSAWPWKLTQSPKGKPISAWWLFQN